MPCCAVLCCALPSHVICYAVPFHFLLHSSKRPVFKFQCQSCLAGEKLDARAAIAGRYISLEEPNTDATASTSGRDSTATSNHQQQQQQQQQQLYWESGLFDKDSWIEAHPGWAKSVVTGRARLGGMPCGEWDLTISLRSSICPVQSTLFSLPCSICPALSAPFSMPCDMNIWVWFVCTTTDCRRTPTLAKHTGQFSGKIIAAVNTQGLPAICGYRC